MTLCGGVNSGSAELAVLVPATFVEREEGHPLSTLINASGCLVATPVRS